MICEHRFETGDALVEKLAAEIAARLELSLSERERASLLVSGGSSPAPLYRRLADAALDWERIDIALVDERRVAETHPRSNARFIRDTLLQQRAAKARFTGMVTGDTGAADELARVEAAYRALPRPFDVTLLGMGPDGHIASLFPRAEGLAAALDPGGENLCAAITARRSAVTGEETERMTLTLAGILNSRAIYLLLGGEAKRARYREALESGGDVQDLPVRALLHQEKVPVDVYWAP